MSTRKGGKKLTHKKRQQGMSAPLPHCGYFSGIGPYSRSIPARVTSHT